MLLLQCIFLNTFCVYAQEEYSDTNMIKTNMSFSNDEIYVNVTITGAVDIRSIDDCSITITGSSGDFYKSWDNLSSQNRFLVITKTASGVTKGETYTVTVTATFNSEDDSETVTETYTKKYE